jgi:hypothetical protein
MDALLDGLQTHGRKGLVYDWQSLLVPDEPQFTHELEEIITEETVTQPD